MKDFDVVYADAQVKSAETQVMASWYKHSREFRRIRKYVYKLSPWAQIKFQIHPNFLSSLHKVM